MSENKCIMIGHVKELSGHEYGTRVYSTEAAAPCVVCGGGGYQDIKILEGDCMEYRIRKLTPRECFRLQGVKDEDYDNVRKEQRLFGNDTVGRGDNEALENAIKAWNRRAK